MANLITQITPWGGNTNYAVRASAVQYGTCATGASTGTKAVTCSSFTSNYLTEGSIIAVKFTYANTAAVANLQLNVNSTGAKPIKCITNGTLGNLPSTSALKNGPIYLFYYDGTNWVALLNSNDVPTYTSSSNTVTFGATTTIGSLNGTEMTITMTSLPSASTTTAGIIQIGTSSTNAAAGNHAHGNITSSGMIPVATGTCTIGTNNRLVFVDDNGYIHSTRLTFNTTTTDYAKYALTQYGTWEEFGTGSGSGAFFINLDFASEDLDKTGTEIDQAYDNGANLILTYGNSKINLRLNRMIQGTNQRSYYFTGIGEDGVLAYILIRTDSTGGAAFIDFGYYGLAPSEHSHGYINRYGVLILSEVINNTTYSRTATIGTGDILLIADSSDDNLIKGTNISFNTTSENYALSRTGNWVGYVKSGQGSTNGNKALYTDNVGTVTVGTLPVNVGGTGATSFTANSLIMSGSTTTGALTTRAITNNTSNTAVTSNNTNIPTMNTIYYGLATVNGASQSRATNVYTATTTAPGVNAILYASGTGTTSALSWKASAAGALYSTGSNSALTFSTLPVSYGGTGLTTVTSGSVLIGNGTSALTTRAITNNTSATTATTNSNLITGSTLYYATANINNARQTSNVGIYAPTGGGTAGQILTASGSTSAPVWTNTANITVGAADTASKIGTATIGSSNQPVFINGGTVSACHYPQSGAWFNSVPYIGSAGVMEVGKYLDFHNADTDTTDYANRLTANENRIVIAAADTASTTLRNISYGTAAPSGGSNGDVYIQYS